MDVESFPIIVLEQFLSILPVEELSKIRLVCRQFNQLSNNEMEKRIFRQKDWRLDVLQTRFFSPFKVWSHFQHSKNKHSPFTQRRTRTGPMYHIDPSDFQMNEVRATSTSFSEHDHVIFRSYWFI